MVEVYGQVSSDGRRWAALIVAAAVLAGCGSVSLEAGDAGLDQVGPADAGVDLGGAAGTTGAAGTGAGGSSSPDARHDAPPSSTPDARDGAPGPSCSASSFRDTCTNYSDRRTCVIGCRGADGSSWPQGAKTCTAPPTPVLQDITPICVNDCNDCPAN